MLSYSICLKSLTVFEINLSAPSFVKKQRRICFFGVVAPLSHTADSVQLEGMGDRWNDNQMKELAGLGTTLRVKPSDSLL